jgi:uncharacterized protein YkwD
MRLPRPAALPAAVLALAALAAALPAQAEQASSGSAGVFQASINAARAHAGLATLSVDPVLTAAAQAYAVEMAQTGHVSHVGLDGSHLQDRAFRAGCGGGWMAENLAWGQDSTEDVFVGWMSSPSHHVNMMGPNYRVYGLAQANGMWVMMLADGC